MTQEHLFAEAPDPEPAQAPSAAPPTRPSEARLYKPVRNQVEMMMRDLDSLLPEDHPGPNNLESGGAPLPA